MLRPARCNPRPSVRFRTGPTLIREQGFEVRIYTLDHPPPHVHVAKTGAVVMIDLSTQQAVEIVGTISDRDVRRAERLVEQNAEFLRKEWEKREVATCVAIVGTLPGVVHLAGQDRSTD